MTMQTEQHDRDVEQMLSRSRFTTPQELDEQILNDATRELRTAPRPSAPSRIWRRAAVILLALGAAAALIAYFDRPSITLAQVAESSRSSRGFT